MPRQFQLRRAGGHGRAMASSSLSSRSGCGCRGNHTLLVVAYHKGGCTLMEELLAELERECGIRTLHPSRHNMTKPARRASRCRTSLYDAAAGGWAYVKMPGAVLSSWERLRQFVQPRPNRQFVHVLREPIKLAVSFYLYHRQGEEKARMYAPLVGSLRSMGVRDGIVYATHFLLRYQLPAMASMHRTLGDRADATTLRLDEITASSAGFDAAASSLLTAAGVDAAHAQSVGRLAPLMDALRRHDLRRAGAGSSSRPDGTKHAHVDGTAPWENSSLVRATLSNEASLMRDLRQHGRALGYRYDVDDGIEPPHKLSGLDAVTRFLDRA